VQDVRRGNAAREVAIDVYVLRIEDVLDAGLELTVVPPSLIESAAM
jgi:hypothetical protein